MKVNIKKEINKFKMDIGHLGLIDTSINSLFRTVGTPKMANFAVHYRRLGMRPIHYRRRKHLAQAYLENRQLRQEISDESGYMRFDEHFFPQVEPVIAKCQDLLKKKDVLSKEFFDKRLKSKEFFFNVLTPEDLYEHPILMQFVLSDPIVEIYIKYFGYIPRLSSIGLYVSPVNSSVKRSQLWHWDGNDPRNVKCFINVSDVGPDDGPFTFIPAKASTDVAIRAGNRWRSPDVSEDFEKQHAVAATGKPGSGAFVDTAKCLHYGSRTKNSTRIVFMFQYLDFATQKDPGVNYYRDIRLQHHPDLCKRFSNDPLRTELLKLDKRYYWSRCITQDKHKTLAAERNAEIAGV